MIINDVAKDDICLLTIIPAKTIYEEERKRPLWYLKEAFWMAKDMLFTESNTENRVRAWQYLKAFTALLKMKDGWDFKKGAPVPNPEWYKLAVDSPEWIAYYCSHPETQMAMLIYKRSRETQEGVTICLS